MDDNSSVHRGPPRYYAGVDRGCFDVGKNQQQRGQRKNRQNRRGGRSSLPLQVAKKFSQSREYIHKVSRTTPITNVGLYPASGFYNGGQFDLALAFSLKETVVYLHGVSTVIASNSGYTELTALFDEWRIESVELAVMVDLNSVNPGAVGTMSLPLMNIAFDPNDADSISQSVILQYEDVHIVQLGNQRTADGYVLKFTPSALSQSLTTAATSSSAMHIPKGTWLRTSVPDVAHYGIKMFYDNCGSSLATEGASMVLYAKYNLEFRNVI